jgi:hypothetical protein
VILLSTTLISACGAPAARKPAAQKPAAQKPAAQNTITITAPANYTEHSYRGAPDLGLTAAIVQAGGGADRFDSRRLYQTLAGPHAKAEAVKLQKLYGKAKMAAFMQTLTYAVHDLNTLFNMNHVALPAKPRISPKDGRAMTVAIYQAGVMPTGKYDCGYMMEHLMTHPIHLVLMHDINVARFHGPAHNANFHIILTRMVADLRDAYTRNGKTS